MNTTEPFLKECICGHKVKQFTYLFNEKNQKMVYIGTTCCKKHGIEKHTNNEILLHVLREQISQKIYKNLENIIILEKDLEKLLEEYIYERFRQIMTKYSRDMDENIYYFDVFIHLNRMKDDILELMGYGYDFKTKYDEILDILRERDIHIRETYDSDSETNSVIIEKLNKIEDEISELLNENSDFEYEESDLVFEDEYLEEMNVSDNFIEKDLEENLRIEEEIKKEMNVSEKIIEEYLEYEEKELEYKQNLFLENDNKKIYSERDVIEIIKMHDLKKRIENLKNDVTEFKNNVTEFKKNVFSLNENIENFKNQMLEFNKNIQ